MIRAEANLRVAIFGGLPRFLRPECRQTGVAAVEFALVLPIVLLIVFGIVELGIALYDKAVITNASREATRAGVVLRTPILDDASIKNIVKNQYGGALISFSGAKTLTTTVTHGVDADNGNVPMLTVKVDYVYGGLLLAPLLGVFTGPVTLSATTSMDYE